MTPGQWAEYHRRLEIREARRQYVREQLATNPPEHGWTLVAGRGWSRNARKRAHLRNRPGSVQGLDALA